jgi:hypothetical protein
MQTNFTGRRLLPSLSFLVAFGATFANSYAALIDFEGVPDSTPITTQYNAEGVTFSNATILTSGLSLNELEFPPFSGLNVIGDDGGPLLGEFATPVSFISGRFTYASPITFVGFDLLGNQVVSTTSQFNENFFSTGNPTNEVISLSFATGIKSFRITGDPLLGGSFALDNLSFTAIVGPASVPEPGSAIAGVACIVCTLWRRRAVSRRDSETSAV